MPNVVFICLSSEVNAWVAGASKSTSEPDRHSLVVQGAECGAIPGALVLRCPDRQWDEAAGRQSGDPLISVLADWDWLADERLGERLRALDHGDQVIVPITTATEIERLRVLYVHTRAEGALSASLHLVLLSKEAAAGSDFPLRLEPATLSFHSVNLHASTSEAAARFAKELGVPVSAWSVDTPPADACPALERTSAKVKIALLFTSLWGRVGSSVIFDGQARYLASRGYLVVRVFYDQWPNTSRRQTRLRDLVQAELQSELPFLAFIAERNADSSHISSVANLAVFQNASPVRRTQMLLSRPKVYSRTHLARLAAAAEVAVVNHVTLVDFAKSLVACPVILETQDIFSDLLDVHGIPFFVPPGPDGAKLRREEERATWRNVAACVNLTAADQAEIARSAPQSFLIRPYVEPPRSGLVDPPLGAIDILLWGSGHRGNISGINWFLDEVLPLSPLLSSACIVVAGAASTFPEIRRRSRGNVRLVGVVPSLEPYLQTARVLVIPDQGGSGLSIKLMDATARGLCFSTTVAGARDAEVASLGLKPAATAAEMALDVEALLRSDEARTQRAALARELYQRNFSREAFVDGWDAVFSAVQPQMTDATSVSAAAEQVRSSSGDRPRLSVLVCTYNRYDLLADCIESLLHQDLDGLEIIVVDNSSDQRAAARFAERYSSVPNLRYLLEPIPGLSRARNVGVKASRSDLIAFIDDDAVAEPDWARQLVEAFGTFPGPVGAVGGPVLPVWPVSKPDWINEKFYGLLSIVQAEDRVRALLPHEWIAGCNMAFRRSSLERSGGFSENLGRKLDGHVLMANEELEVTLALRALGEKIVHTPFASVHHHIHPSRLNEAWLSKRAAWQAVSDLLTAPTAGVHAFALDAPRRLYEGAGEKTDTPRGRVMAAYDLVAVCLAGEYRHLETRPKLRFPYWRTIVSLPRRALRRLRRLLSELDLRWGSK